MLSPNTRLQNRYTVLRLLAKGGMGAVYEARDERLGNIVALKETLFVDEGLRLAFHREASILATLRHQALPKVIDHFTEGDGQFLVMEYIRGEDLSLLLRLNGRPIPQIDALAWADQLLGALEYLHSQNPPVIHRDIKPQNLKLNDRGEVILLDFGLAKEAGLDTTTTSSSGQRSVRGYTLNYAPLEQIQGAGTDPRSDLYSLAATFYHLMTGVVPTDAVTRATALIEGRADPLRPAEEINTQISPAVSEALDHALTLDRNNRPANAALMRTALQKTAKSESAKAALKQTRMQTAVNETAQPAIAPATQPYGTATVAQAPAHDLLFEQPRKSRAVIWIACALALVAIASFASLSWDRKEPEQAAAAGKNDPRPSPTATPAVDKNLLTSREILGDGTETERTYSFIAEAGELKFTLDVLGNGSTVKVEAIDEKKELMKFDEGKFTLTSNGEDEKKVQSLTVPVEQTVTLRVRTDKDLQAFRLRIDGPAKLKEDEAAGAEKPALAALFAPRDRPLPLASKALFGGQGEKKSTYYAFTAGPGEIKFTLNVIGNGASVSAEIFNDKSEPILFDGGSTKFTVSSNQQYNEEGNIQLNLDRPQKLLLRVYCANPQMTKAYRLRIEGPVQLGRRDKSNPATDISDEVKKLFAPRDSPEALTSKEISDRTLGAENYFTFTAGPGALFLNLEVEGKGAALKVELFDRQSNRLRFSDNAAEFSLTSSGKREKNKAEIEMKGEEELLMRLSTSSPESVKKFHLKLEGAFKKH